YVVMSVQDARAVNEHWLEELLNGFSVAENVAAVCGSQIVPHDRDKNPVEWFRPQSEPMVSIYHYKSAGSFDALTPYEKMRACGWDDVTAMYNRELLLQLPFKKTSCSEDIIWAREALKKGYTLVYNPAAKVYHYHHGDQQFAFRRTLTVMHTRYRQFGFIYSKPSRSFRQVLSLVKTLFKSEPLTVKEKLAWFTYNREQLKGEQKAFEIFSSALAESEEKLDAVHEQFCGRPQMHQKRLSKI
ncbi:MAG: hypothetical protein M3Y85_04710, partial [Bacteroidota bacterium]|nr:hypothetical protein [Bacteroidota bacterium]